MRVRYTPRAFADREAIFDYINERNPRAAREVKAFIEKRISALGDLDIPHRAIPKLGVHALWLGAIHTSSTTGSVGTKSRSFIFAMPHGDLGKATGNRASKKFPVSARACSDGIDAPAFVIAGLDQA